MTNKIQIELAPKLIPILSPELGTYRYRVLRGGRGSGKSFSVALMSAIWGATKRLRILCTRELQNSIKESFYAEVVSAINSNNWLASTYHITEKSIRNKETGTEFIFAGLRHNIESIKSISKIDLCIVEEAEQVPHTSWRDLIPTIRQPNSEIIIIYNPKRRDSYVAERFAGANIPKRTTIAEVNHDDNPWFSGVLEEEREYDEESLDPALYNHIWKGAYYEQSEAQIFANKHIKADFEVGEDWAGPYYGLDFGFANDPTAAVRAWVHDKTLYIDKDFSQVRLELDDTAKKLKERLGGIESHKIRADNARPESISYLKRNGLPRIEACKKGKGSVEDGIKFIRSFKKVVIHSECEAIAREFELYSYKTDRLTGEVLPAIVDKHNHCIDALRYALEPLIKNKGFSLANA